MSKKRKIISKNAIALSLIFLAVFVVEGLLILGAIWLIERLNVFSSEANIIYVVAAVSASIVLGFVSNYIINKFAVKKVEKFKEVIEEIANGNYTQVNEELKLPLYKDVSNEFNKMIKEINSSYIMKQDFVNHISHELKTPLVSIQGYAELLKESPDLSIEEKEMYLDIIIGEVKRLSNLSSEALMMSKLDSTIIMDNVEVFRLDTQLEECILLLDNEFKKKNIMTEINLKEAKVKANRDLLKEVWLNLLTNAIKYSQNDSSVIISIEVDENVLVKIKDHGIGMSEEVKNHIFDKYYRANNAKVQGIGLGLSIAKKVIEISGGSIEVVSQEGEGSEFIVTMPIE